MTHCEYDCYNDFYDSYVQEMVDYITHKILPQRIRFYPNIVKNNEMKKLTDRMRYNRIVKCDKGTNHVWRMSMKEKDRMLTL